MIASNIFKEELLIDRGKRESLLQQKAFVVWFTGLSGAGKSTLSKRLEEHLCQKGLKTMVLDGDNTRLGVNKDLKFSAADRSENIRRVAEICKLFNDAGIVILASFISPYHSDRSTAKSIVGGNCFVEVFVDAPLNVCIERDTKGLYQKAKEGIITDFTGVSSPYEKPQNPNITLNTDTETIEESIEIVLEYLKQKKFIAWKEKQ